MSFFCRQLHDLLSTELSVDLSVWSVRSVECSGICFRRVLFLTLTTAPTGPSQSLTPRYSTSIARATTHRSPQRTYPPASTDGYHPFHRTKHHSTKPPPRTKKHSTKADTTTLYTTNRLQLLNGETDNATTYIYILCLEFWHNFYFF